MCVLCLNCAGEKVFAARISRQFGYHQSIFNYICAACGFLWVDLNENVEEMCD